MKKNNLFTAIGISIVFLFSILLLSSCQKKENSDFIIENPIESSLKYKKEITVFDKSQNNSVTIMVATNSKEIHEKINSEMIIFTTYDQDYLESQESGGLGSDYTEDEIPNIETNSNIEIEIHTISESLAEGVVGYGVSLSNSLFNESLDNKSTSSTRACTYPTIAHYAISPFNTLQATNTTCQTVVAKFCSKNYWDPFYSCNSTNGGQKILNVNQYWPFCRDNKYALRAKIKYNACCQQGPTFINWIQYGGCN